MALTPARSPGFLLWHATLRWQRAIAGALAPLGLTHVQFVLLASAWWLNREGHTPTQVALAAFAGTDVKMTSQVLRSLQAKQLLARHVDPADTRARRVTVTAAGEALAPRAIAAVEAVDEAFFAGLPRERVLELMTRLVGPGAGDQAPAPGGSTVRRSREGRSAS